MAQNNSGTAVAGSRKLKNRNFVKFTSMVHPFQSDNPKNWTKPKVEATQKSLLEILEESIRVCGGKIPTHIYPKGEKTPHAEETM